MDFKYWTPALTFFHFHFPLMVVAIWTMMQENIATKQKCFSEGAGGSIIPVRPKKLNNLTFGSEYFRQNKQDVRNHSQER